MLRIATSKSAMNLGVCPVLSFERLPRTRWTRTDNSHLKKQ